MARWDDVLAVNPEVMTHVNDGELIVILPKGGKYIVLNPTGARVLKLADGTRTLRDVAQVIAQESGVTPQRAESDILKFAQMLVERGVLISVKQETG